MNIEIICPLYNAEKYISNLHKSFLKQEKIDNLVITYILTKGTDNTEKTLRKLNAKYYVIEKSEFNHSYIREKYAMLSNADIIVFVTQDVIIKRNDWLYNLTIGISEERYAASYSRQLCTNNSIEKYTRENNYPDKSFTVSKEDISKKGLKTFFFSDAAGAINLEVFKKLKGYDNKKLPISEDMYFAYKLIMAGYKIGYCSDSVVEHSHQFSFKELYNRYYLTGQFFNQNSYLDQYGTTDSGVKLAIYIFKSAIKDFNIVALMEFFPNMIARYLGMRNGRKRGGIYENID